MAMITRRAALAGLGALAAFPVGAEPGWDGVAQVASGLGQLHALMIAHHGNVVLAERFRGPALDRPVNVKSVSKTLVATVLGVAIERGVVPGVDAPLGRIAPDLIPDGADPRVADLTLADLVTMQAGLERTSGPNYAPWVASRNWVANALSRPFVADPGAVMLYSTGSYHVLGAALARAAGESLLSLTRAWIGRPLGIEVPSWTRDPQGFYLGGNEMAMSPLAMLRFAEMVRNGGRHGTTQVLDPGWIGESFTPRTRSPYSGLDYGYGWFIGQMDGATVALARGYGGQVIAVAPERGLSVAITSDPTRPARTDGHFGDLMALLGSHILPVARL